MATLEDGNKQCSEPDAVPQHVAIIMDGNGRWAAAHGLKRYQGHRRGMESLRGAVRYASEVGISYLTLYSFSSENWSRPDSEIKDLMQLLRFFIRRDLAQLKREGVRIRVIGAREGVEEDILQLLDEAEEKTRENTHLTLTIAFNYGSRDEITRAVSAIAKKVEGGDLRASDISTQTISDHLDTAGAPDPDLLIRTSGEVRLSNFLLWQCAYSELVFLDVYWPDFDAKMFGQALAEYRRRDRRFGGLKAGATG